MKISKNILNLLSKKEKLNLTILICFMLIGTLFETLGIGLVVPILTLILDGKAILQEFSIFNDVPFLKNYLNSNSQEILIVHGVIFLTLVFLIKNLFLIFLSWRNAKFIFDLRASLEARLFSGYLNQKYDFFIKKNSSTFTNTIINEVSIFCGQVITASLYLFNELFVFCAIFSLLIILEPTGSFFILSILGIVFLVLYKKTKKILKNWSEIRLYHDEKRIRNLNEGFGMFKYLWILGLQDKFVNLFKSHNKKVVDAGKVHMIITQLPKKTIEFFGVLSLSTLILVMLYQNIPISKILPVVAAFAVAAFRLMPSLNLILVSLQSIKFGIPSIKVLNEEIQFNDVNSINKKVANNLKLKSSIKLSNVSFSYNKHSAKILNAIDLEILKGEMVGIIGKTGSGKSTLIDIILGALPVAEGSIKYDNNEVANKQIYRNIKIGYVPQSIFLLDETIKNNIVLEQSKFDEERFQKAIEIAQLNDFINNLPKGVDTLIGENGLRISGGQRQRIGISRSLYQNPELLILDEATNALDMKTEKEFFDSLSKYKKELTIILSTHRLSIIRNCTNVYKVASGKLTKLNQTTNNYHELTKNLGGEHA